MVSDGFTIPYLIVLPREETLAAASSSWLSVYGKTFRNPVLLE